MTEIKYSDLEKLIEDTIRQWVEDNDIIDYDNPCSCFNYVDGLGLASDITTELYLLQRTDGIKVVGAND